TVAGFYHISLEEMKGKRRDKHIVFPRQVAMYLIREETASSLAAIGQAFGGRDHTTVLHSYEKINTDAREDQRLQNDLRKLREMLYSHWGMCTSHGRDVDGGLRRPSWGRDGRKRTGFAAYNEGRLNGRESLIPTVHRPTTTSLLETAGF